MRCSTTPWSLMEASVREPQQEFMFLPLRQGQDTQMESEQSKGDCEGGFVACLPQFGWLAALDGNGEVRGSVNGQFMRQCPWAW